jgi:hypothetical protein
LSVRIKLFKCLDFFKIRTKNFQFSNHQFQIFLRWHHLPGKQSVKFSTADAMFPWTRLHFTSSSPFVNSGSHESWSLLFTSEISSYKKSIMNSKQTSQFYNNPDFSCMVICRLIVISLFIIFHVIIFHHRSSRWDYSKLVLHTRFHNLELIHNNYFKLWSWKTLTVCFCSYSLYRSQRPSFMIQNTFLMKWIMKMSADSRFLCILIMCMTRYNIYNIIMIILGHPLKNDSLQHWVLSSNHSKLSNSNFFSNDSREKISENEFQLISFGHLGYIDDYLSITQSFRKQKK